MFLLFLLFVMFVMFVVIVVFLLVVMFQVFPMSPLVVTPPFLLFPVSFVGAFSALVLVRMFSVPAFRVSWVVPRVWLVAVGLPRPGLGMATRGAGPWAVTRAWLVAWDQRTGGVVPWKGVVGDGPWLAGHA